MSSSSLFAVQQNVARYGLSTLLVFGNFGNLFTIIILTRTSKQRVNSCSLYLLSASISNWIVINTALVSNIVGVDHIDPQHTSNVICKLRWSGVHALLMLSRSFSKFIHSILIFIFAYLYSDCCLHRSMGALFTKCHYSILCSAVYSCSCNSNFTHCLDNHTYSSSCLFQ
jgi:hypothetical protein